MMYRRSTWATSGALVYDESLLGFSSVENPFRKYVGKGQRW